MALIPFNHPNIDRIIDSAYEAYTNRLFEEAYGDQDEKCENCRYCEKVLGHTYCIKDYDETDDDAEYEAVNPDYCCMHWDAKTTGDYWDDDYEKDWQIRGTKRRIRENG